MPGFLLHLQGPMQSYADTGFGQLREAGLFPSRAAVLGIVAAAIGIERGDPALVGLHDAFKIHVAAVRPGQVLKDYHTVETELTRPKTLTWRDYYHDAHFVACLLTGDEAIYVKAVEALKHPVYTSFLGRRSCPPAVPLWPEPVGEGWQTGLLNTAQNAREKLPRTEERRWGNPKKHEEIDLYLDGYFTNAKPAVKDFADLTHTHGVRRDRLVSPARAYVNRPYTHVRVRLAEQNENEQEAFFDAAS